MNDKDIGPFVIGMVIVFASWWALILTGVLRLAGER